MAEHAHTTPALGVIPTARRKLFTRAAAMALLASLGASGTLSRSAVASASAVRCPDAGLIRLCKAFHETHQATQVDDDATWEVRLDQRWEISDAIEGMTATTDAGRRAKAGVALVLMDEMGDVRESHDRFAMTVLRELAASATA